jgi:hypothetical protein
MYLTNTSLKSRLVCVSSWLYSRPPAIHGRVAVDMDQREGPRVQGAWKAQLKDASGAAIY